MVPTPTEDPVIFAFFGKPNDLIPIKPGSIEEGEKAQKNQQQGTGVGKSFCRKPAMTVIFTHVMEGVNPVSFLNGNCRDNPLLNCYGTNGWIAGAGYRPLSPTSDEVLPPRGSSGRLMRTGCIRSCLNHENGRFPYRPARVIGQTLHPAISPKQKRNRSLIVFGSRSSWIGTKPNVL
jgi:hypothetical protein